MLQFSYQICVQGRVDLPLAPDEPTGFAMTLLRLLAFMPVSGPDASRERVTAAAPPISAATADSQAKNVAAATPVASKSVPGSSLPKIEDWPGFVASMKLSGMALQLAAQTELKAIAGNEIVLALPEASRHLTDKVYVDKLKAALDEALGRRVRLR